MKNVLEYLERAAEKEPDKTAVDDGETEYSYHQLHDLSRRLGSTIALKSKANKPVIVFLDKSADTLAIFLGIVYAGCFYVLVSPEFPVERVRKMIGALDADLAVTKETYVQKLKEGGFSGEILEYDTVIDQSRIDEQLLLQVQRNMQPEDILYGIFTTGSTGVPKNVIVSHKAVIDFIEDFCEVSEISSADRIGNQAPFDFDVSVKDIYSSLCVGATMVLIPKAMFSQPDDLLSYLSEKKVSVLIWAVTALCMVTRAADFTKRIAGTIRKVLFSGEVMPLNQLEIWRTALPDAEFYNVYGPTEVTCNCTWYKIGQQEKFEKKVPIGVPFPKRKIYLLNEQRKEIKEPDVMGEICVGGDTLATGYLNNESEQKKKFIRNPLEDNGETVYCTGDLGYYGTDSQLYYAGRKDYQVKRMGHRIELEEVELAIANVPGVRHVCCVFCDESQVLVAFYTGDTQRGEVRRAIRKAIPVYMMPNRIFQLDEMPVNKNGKTDRGFLKSHYKELFAYTR